MKNLNICIDIDGTITDAYYWLDLCNEYFGTNITPANVTEYRIHKVLGVTEDAYIKFYEKYKYKLHSDQKIEYDAKLYIERLHKLHNIYFVTARDKSLTMLTHSYLRKYKIPYDGLHVLGSHNKVSTAKELACDVFIEDCYDNAIQLSSTCSRVLLIDTNYNQGPLNDNILRVHNWREIYATIDDLLMQQKAI